MVDQIGIIITFIFFLLLFTGVGTYSATQKKATTTDYLLASRNVNPVLTALSAMATGQSGLLFIGQVGFAYKIGISAIWLIIGWAIGDYLPWWFVFKPLREQSEATNSETVSAFLAQNIQGYRLISLVSALITLAFLGSYAAAQLVAGSKALNTVFGWNYNLGIIIGAIIVVIYCFSGGIRASIWTDALQAILMLGSLLLLLIVALPDLLTSGDPELALPYLSLELLPVVLVGLILAGLFSATMSTADSQILSCSAALTQDIFPQMSNSYNLAKIGTLTVNAVILVIALAGDNNVFALVTFSWSALASGLGPLLLIKVWQQPINTVTAIAMMIIGITTALIWNLVLNLSGVIYEVLPGMVAGMAVYGLSNCCA